MRRVPACADMAAPVHVPDGEQDDDDLKTQRASSYALARISEAMKRFDALAKRTAGGISPGYVRRQERQLGKVVKLVRMRKITLAATSIDPGTAG